MSEWQDEALVLRLGHFSESHVWLRLLSRRHGLVSAFAFGALRSKRRFCGCLDLLNDLFCHVKSSGRDQYLVLQEASLQSGPGKLRANWRRMGLAANCMLFLQNLEITGDSSEECFQLLKNLRDYLDSAVTVTPSLAAYFRLRVSAALGFAPSFGQCGRCGRELQQGLFLGREGRTFCPDCAGLLAPQHKRQGQWLNSPALRHLERVKRSSVRNWHDGCLGSSDRRLCGQAIQAFISYHFDSPKARND